MKLLLTSDGLKNASIINSLKNLADKPLTELNIAFIPTAANVEPEDKRWFIDNLVELKDQNFSMIDIVDISALEKSVWLPRLKNADIFMFSGGNTQYLMSWITKSGLEKELPELLKTRIYIGISAGSMVPTKNLVLGDSSQLYNEDIFDTEAMPGLGYVDFHVRPHLNSPNSPNVKEKRLTEIAQKLPEPIYAIDDQTAIQVVDGEITVISEGEWKKFN
jgi:dipeptidase E